MHYSEGTETKEPIDSNEDQQLDFDGSTNLDNPDDDVPHIKGLIELLNQYIGAKRS
ncbi:MAG: hypothetical protein GY935_24005 [Gammaproteobacteria bacterium]|nr:hypothetical protein [Gammaproteobacteria bacterium]